MSFIKKNRPVVSEDHSRALFSGISRFNLDRESMLQRSTDEYPAKFKYKSDGTDYKV
jgi:hypothetical protein